MANTGDRVRATSREMSTEAETVMPKGLKNCPIVPPMLPTGKNTATIVKVAAETVKPISEVASNAA